MEIVWLLFAAVYGSVHAYESVNLNVSQPQSNAPLNHTLAWYNLRGFNGADGDLTHSFIQTDCGANISIYHTEPSVWGNQTGTAQRPILILAHGYPESSYTWRNITPCISTRVPIFVPDQPGYGLSTPCCNATGCAYDKRTYARALMQAVTSIYGNVSVVYAGHDRGARTMHRAAVDNNFPGITGLGLFAIDVVPFIAEYASFSNPFWAQNYFHWSFLPKGNFATDVIMAYGGGNWIRRLLEYGKGQNERGIELLQAGDAYAVYENFYNQLSVTNTSVFDYVDGASVDYDQQLADQNSDIKIDIPTHVMYSVYNLGSEFDVPAVWANYTRPGANLTVEGVAGGIGHWVNEEAPNETLRQLNEFMDRLGVAK